MLAEFMKRRVTSAAVAALGLTCAIAAPASEFAVDWYSIDGGGSMFIVGGAFELSGTIGQPDACSPLAPMTGGSFELVGGFWSAGSSPTPCPGDTNADGIIDLADLATLLANFGTPSGATPAQGDSDGDGDVELSDLTALLSRFGTTCP